MVNAMHQKGIQCQRSASKTEEKMKMKGKRITTSIKGGTIVQVKAVDAVAMGYADKGV